MHFEILLIHDKIQIMDSKHKSLNHKFLNTEPKN